MSIQSIHGSRCDVKRGGRVSRHDGLNLLTALMLNLGEDTRSVTVKYNEFVCEMIFHKSSGEEVMSRKAENERLGCLKTSSVTLSMTRLLYFTGRSGDWLDAIGFAYIPAIINDNINNTEINRFNTSVTIA